MHVVRIQEYLSSHTRILTQEKLIECGRLERQTYLILLRGEKPMLTVDRAL